ncbi:hypothetical protein GOEFS_018_00460 [Gordonia effusa NBRC 100432]|uniref:Uncharacterized protein n=1 Tax=Gordonia effusa NBRC 100432 TaxID=1077974 RepID=H0QW12_9ACTN|nr:hypothetical protein GOEFS_018_00460 [Gordonia effusa NBRC 100432]
MSICPGHGDRSVVSGQKPRCDCNDMKKPWPVLLFRQVIPEVRIVQVTPPAVNERP